MVAYNVPEALARAVVFGLKCSVLKPHGNLAHAAVGDMLHIDTGDLPPDWSKSTGYCRLMEVPCCLSVPVRIEADRFLRDGVIDVDGHRMELVSQAEGFETYAAMRAHFERSFGLPWEGQLLRWNPLKATFRAQWPLVTRVVDEGEGGDA